MKQEFYNPKIGDDTIAYSFKPLFVKKGINLSQTSDNPYLPLKGLERYKNSIPHISNIEFIVKGKKYEFNYFYIGDVDLKQKACTGQLIGKNFPFSLTDVDKIIFTIDNGIVDDLNFEIISQKEDKMYKKEDFIGKYEILDASRDGNGYSADNYIPFEKFFKYCKKAKIKPCASFSKIKPNYSNVTDENIREFQDYMNKQTAYEKSLSKEELDRQKAPNFKKATIDDLVDDFLSDL